ncbi:hypothetical protein J2R95_003188 [Bradyrhizobium japonicum]|nr:hypothetical protein [Bradyrhizobium japonicum]
MPTFDYNKTADLLKRIRETVHDHTPGPLTASSLVLGAPGLAAGGAIRALPTLGRTASSLMSNAGASPAAMMMPTAAQAPSALEPEWQKFKAQADQQAEMKPAVPMSQPPWWANGQSFSGPGFPQAPPQTPAPAPTAPQAAPVPVPMPQARPAEVPQAQPDTSFFMRNAMMQRDPSTGELIDPSGAAGVKGPDLISKMLTYLHNK